LVSPDISVWRAFGNGEELPNSSREPVILAVTGAMAMFHQLANKPCAYSSAFVANCWK